LSVVINEDEELIIRKCVKRGRQSGALLLLRGEQRKALEGHICGEKTLCKTHLLIGFSLKGSMDGRLEGPDERLERASESRREALRLGGGYCDMMSIGLCTGEEIDLGVIGQGWRRMRKGRERARKGGER
jgi:hypothetical protein